jgi:hypothetical protein
MRRAPKQTQIAEVILSAADRGEYLNVTQIHAGLPYKCAYGSLRKTLKVFEDRNLITKVRTGMCVTIKPNLTLYHWFRS